MYLCYDVRGIQSFIFRIPKLKYIIGGSALIDRFDRETTRNIIENNNIDGCQCLFTGGGKGSFDCDTKESAQKLQKAILSEAHKIGVDIRFGMSESYDDASKHAENLFPYIPDNLSGSYPCNISGLYPVATSEGEHPIVRKRLFNRNAEKDSDEYKMYRYFENRLLKKEGLAQLLEPENSERAEKLEFFHNVSTTDDQGNDDWDGDIGAKVLGDRNRWAVICMDGNDMGSQMTAKHKELENDPDIGHKMSAWVKAMSAAIDRCSIEATKAGIKAVYDKWVDSDDQQNLDDDEKFVLPIRPLVVGGDDITLLCHVSFAITFVKAACQKFNEVSRLENENSLKVLGASIWPATGGEISISAGVLFCPVSLPLHSAMAYTEALLASAKTRGRKVKTEQVAKGQSANRPTPASIDWENITDSVIETPAIYRRRHLYFKDPEINKNVSLTRKPYTLEEFNAVEDLVQKYKNIPTSIRHKILPALCKSRNDRMAFIASIAKNYKDLAIDLAEEGFKIFGDKPSKWIPENNEISTSVIDALQLLEEDKRMEEGTNND